MLDRQFSELWLELEEHLVIIFLGRMLTIMICAG